MRIGISGLTIGGLGGLGGAVLDLVPQVVKDRIDAALIAEPTAPAYFIDTQGGKLFTDAGGTVVAGDGDPVRSFRTAYGTDLLTTVPVDGIITYDETNKMFEMSGANHQTVIPATGDKYSPNATMHFVIETTDAQWTLGKSTSGAYILSALDNSAGTIGSQVGAYEVWVNGQSVGVSGGDLDQNAFRDLIAASGKVVVTLRDFDMSLNGRWDANGVMFFQQDTFNIALDGKVGSFMVSQTGSREEDFAIAQAIGSLHDITIEETLATEIFSGADFGDIFPLVAANTDGTLHGDAVTSVTGLRGSVLTNGGNPTLSIVDGLEGVAFDGNDSLRVTLAQTLTQPCTIWAGFNDVQTTAHVIFTGGDASNRVQLSIDSSANIIGFAGNVVDTGANASINRRTAMIEANGASSKIYLDGMVVWEGNLGAQTVDEFVLGSLWDNTIGMVGQAHTVGYIDRVLTDSEKALVNTDMDAAIGRSLPVGMPSSVKDLLLPSDLIFSGGVLTGITKTFGGTKPFVVGSPAEGADGGWVSSPDTTFANYVSYELPALNIADPTGVHLTIVYKPDADISTKSILAGLAGFANYIGISDSASSSTITSLNGSVSKYRIDGVDYTNGVVERDQLHAALYTDKTLQAVTLHNIRYPTNNLLYLGRYDDAPSKAFNFKGQFFAIGLHTDEAQTDAVQAALLAAVV